MVYRFLLEVPEILVDEANITVGSAGDAQVVVVRNSHGQGFDDPYSDLTIAAHSLGVIRTIYEWYDGIRALQPNLALVLHSGQRISLGAMDRDDMIASIRRDQPWAEHSVPRIGDHMRDVVPAALKDRSPAPVTRSAHLSPQQPILVPRRKLNLLNRAQVAIDVTELERAERYYVDFLGMSLLGRERELDSGDMELVERDYDGIRALTLGTEADVSYLANGDVTLALERVGRGARLERSTYPPVPIDVDRSTFLQIKGDAYMRGMEINLDNPDSLTVSDIYGLAWQFTVAAHVPALT